MSVVVAGARRALVVGSSGVIAHCLGLYVCVCVYRFSGTSTHAHTRTRARGSVGLNPSARTRAHRPAEPRQSSGVSQTPQQSHGVFAG